MRTALMVWGGWDGHHPRECVEEFAPFLRRSGFDVVVSGTMDAYLDEELMRRADLIVPCVTSFGAPANPEHPRRLCAAVAAGAGLAGWHGGMCDSFRGDTLYFLMTGGQFLAHPGGQVDYDVRLVDRDHPVTSGLVGFRVRGSEQYYLAVDPGNHVLATTGFGDAPEEDGCQPRAVMPVAWTRTYGRGRVFYHAVGHQPRDFAQPEVRTMIERGMLWAAR